MKRCPALLALMVLLLAPAALHAQESGGYFETSTAMGFSLGYVSPLEGLSLGFGGEHFAHVSDGFHVAPAIWGDMLITANEDPSYYRDSENLCRYTDGEYVDDALCAPVIGFAVRGELSVMKQWFWAGPGIRVSDDGAEPYVFVRYGGELFGRVNIGENFQQFELGFVIGI